MSMYTAHAIMKRLSVLGVKSRMITINEDGTDRPALIVETERFWRLAAYLTRKCKVEKCGTYAIVTVS